MGADGQIRAANTRVSKKGRSSTLDRPIQHLYPLEVASHLKLHLMIWTTLAMASQILSNKLSTLLGQEGLQLPELGIVFSLKLLRDMKNEVRTLLYPHLLHVFLYVGH